jgi:hypothetical protein
MGTAFSVLSVLSMIYLISVLTILIVNKLLWFLLDCHE